MKKATYLLSSLLIIMAIFSGALGSSAQNAPDAPAQLPPKPKEVIRYDEGVGSLGVIVVTSSPASSTDLAIYYYRGDYVVEQVVERLVEAAKTREFSRHYTNPRYEVYVMRRIYTDRYTTRMTVVVEGKNGLKVYTFESRDKVAPHIDFDIDAIIVKISKQLF